MKYKEEVLSLSSGKYAIENEIKECHVLYRLQINLAIYIL